MVWLCTSCTACSVVYCSAQHAALHRTREYCFPYKVSLMEGERKIERVLQTDMERERERKKEGERESERD